MKCLFVHDHIYLTKAGKVHSNTFSYALLKQYVDIFGEVTVVARHREVDSAVGLPPAKGEGISFVFLESISSINSYFGRRQQHSKKIRELLDEHTAIIVRLPSELGLMTAKIAYTMQKSYLAEVVGCGWDAMRYYGGWQSKLYAPFLFRKMREAVKKADYVSYVTQHFLQKRYPAAKDAEVLAASDVLLPPLDEKILSRRISKIRNMKKRLVLGTIANLNIQYKGVDVALKAMAEVQHHHRDISIEYRIAGGGDSTSYEVLAGKLGLEGRIHFDGLLTGGREIFDWLDKIDIYLQPSYQEGLPRSLVEAISRACPAIGSSAGGIPELLNINALFPRGESSMLAEKIGGLILNSDAMAAEAKENFDTARQYQKRILEPKRRQFLLKYAGHSSQSINGTDTFLPTETGG